MCQSPAPQPQPEDWELTLRGNSGRETLKLRKAGLPLGRSKWKSSNTLNKEPKPRIPVPIPPVQLHSCLAQLSSNNTATKLTLLLSPKIECRGSLLGHVEDREKTYRCTEKPPFIKHDYKSLSSASFLKTNSQRSLIFEENLPHEKQSHKAKNAKRNLGDIRQKAENERSLKIRE